MNAAMVRLAMLIDAPLSLLPAWNVNIDAMPYVEEYDGLMSWVVSERGREAERRETRDLHEWLHWVFDDVTWQLANAWEMRVRIPYVEGRIVRAVKHVDLLHQLDPAWAETGAERYVEILASHPYSDRDYAPSTFTSVSRHLADIREDDADARAMARKIASVYSADSDSDSAHSLDAGEMAFVTCALIADGLSRNGVDLDEVRRLDRWARRMLQDPLS
jgi:hypothetical protein